MALEKQDANQVGFYKAREASLGVIAAVLAWQTREPNSFDDLGGEYTKVARRPFSPSRQRKKGNVTDLDVDGGYNEDLTQNNMQTELEEFFFAALRETPNVVIPADAYAKVFTVVAATDVATIAGGHGLATGDGPFYVSSVTTLPAGLVAATPYWVTVTGANTYKFATSKANALAPVNVDVTDTGTGAHTMTRAAVVDDADDSVLVNAVPTGAVAGAFLRMSGFANPANNGVREIDSVTASKIITVEELANEPTPPLGAKVQVVGYGFDIADLEMEIIESSPGVIAGFKLITTAGDFRIWSLVPGSWLFIGGDAANTSFATGGEDVTGYARIALNGISADGKELTFDKATFTPFDSDGAGKSVAIYFSDVLKNEEDPDLIVRYSSIMERTLGRDDDGLQSEYLTGAVANEMTWNSPLANLVNLDLGYVGNRAGVRKGVDGPLARRVNNTIARALGEDPFNTTSNIFRLRMSAINPDNMAPLPFFARVTEWTMTVANNVSSAKAQGVLGGFDVTVGNFDVDGEFTAYFSTVEAIHAVQCNHDVTFDAIYAKQNAGIYMDVPLIGLGGGRLDIEQDAAIMLPLETAAAESPFGHTLLVGWFPYLPTVAMPFVEC